MDLLQTIRQRRSVRSFLNKNIDRSTLESVIKDASNAPSAINMQPWELHVVSSEEITRLSRKLLKMFEERQITCGPGATQKIPDKFIDRARRAAEDMTPLIEKMGTDFKTFVNRGSLKFYGAPVVLFVFIDDSFPSQRQIDIGSFLGYLVLSATGHGLSTCPIGLVTSYEDEIKDALNIPENKRLVISVAMGYPDKSTPINQFRSERANLEEFVRWIGF
ncbi:MAG: nitroreductase [Desulfomonilaceae bacterium]